MKGIPELDPVIHAPKRLTIMALLDATGSTDFVYLKENVGLSDSDLSKQMSALQQAEYVSIKKLGHGRSGSTSYSLTTKGSAAYREYRRQLAALVNLPLRQIDSSAS